MICTATKGFLLTRGKSLSNRLSRRLREFSSSSSSPRSRPPAEKRPGYSIPAQGFVFTALLLPVLGYTLFASRYGPSQEELEEDVKKRYAAQIAENRQKNQAMADFFQHTIKNPDGKFDDTLREVLHAGRGGKKRFFAVDDKLYGTKDGVEEKERQTEEQRKRAEYRRRKKEDSSTKETASSPDESKSGTSPSQNDIKVPANHGVIAANAKSVATLGAVAALAAGVGFLVGGSRRS